MLSQDYYGLSTNDIWREDFLVPELRMILCKALKVSPVTYGD